MHIHKYVYLFFSDIFLYVFTFKGKPIFYGLKSYLRSFHFNSEKIGLKWTTVPLVCLKMPEILSLYGAIDSQCSSSCPMAVSVWASHKAPPRRDPALHCVPLDFVYLFFLLLPCAAVMDDTKAQAWWHPEDRQMGSAIPLGSLSEALPRAWRSISLSWTAPWALWQTHFWQEKRNVHDWM